MHRYLIMVLEEYRYAEQIRNPSLSYNTAMGKIYYYIQILRYANSDKYSLMNKHK